MPRSARSGVRRRSRRGAGPERLPAPVRGLVEPAFVDVALVGSRPPDATIEFVIWSVSARRLHRIGRDDAPSAVFPLVAASPCWP